MKKIFRFSHSRDYAVPKEDFGPKRETDKREERENLS